MNKDNDRADLDACIQYMHIAISRIKMQEQAHASKPNREFHELADALAPFPDDDHQAALDEARRITRHNIFEARITWPEGKFKEYLAGIPEGHMMLVPKGLIARLEKFLVSTTLSGYSGPRFRLYTPHSGVGILRRKANDEE